ncbi:MAG: aspartate aminotransferase, partial [Pseudomonadota bacterium]
RNHLQSHFNYSMEKEWLVWLPGVASGLTLTCRAIGQEGDEVLINPPIYPPFLRIPMPTVRLLKFLCNFQRKNGKLTGRPWKRR